MNINNIIDIINNATAEPVSGGATRLGQIYHFDIDLGEVFVDLEEEEGDQEYLRQILEAVSDRMRTITPAPMDNRISIAVRVHGASNDWISTRFSTDSASEIVDKLVDLLGRYDSGLLAVSDISVRYFVGSSLASTGNSSRSECVADAKWYKIDTFSVLNCFWIALATCLNFKTNTKLLLDSSERQRSGKDLKVLFKKKHGSSFNLLVSDEPLYAVAAEFRNVIISIYDNLYTVVKTFYPPEVTKKTRKADIMISGNHAVALIPRKDIPKEVVLPEKDKIIHRHGYIKKKYNDFNGREEIVELDTGMFVCLGVAYPSLSDLKRTVKCQKYEVVLYDKKEVLLIDKSKMQLEKVTKVNNKIAAVDLETCMRSTLGGHISTYLIGIAFRPKNVDTKEVNIYGEAQFEAYEGLYSIDNFFEYLYSVRKFFDGYTIYMHNGGRFDMYCILNEHLLADSRRWKISKFLEVEGCLVETVLTSVETNTKPVTVRFVDSYKLCPVSLDALCNSLKTKTRKMTDSVAHHKITEDNFETFLPKVRAYHRNDCVSLLECMEAVSKSLFDDYAMDFTKYLTAPSVAINIFWKMYYDMKKWPIYCLRGGENSIDEFIRRGYLGGRTEAYTLGKIEHSWYYDRVSLYPDVGRNILPYGEPEWIEDLNTMPGLIDENNCLTDLFFGWVEVYIESTNLNREDDELPFFGIKYSTRPLAPKKLVFPKIAFALTPITVFSEAIKYAQSHALSYKYKYGKGVRFKGAPIMKEFFEDRFQRRLEKKSKHDLAGSMMEKLAMNSAYGKFALRCTDRDSLKLYGDNYVNYFKDYHDNKLVNVAQKGNYTLVRKIQDIEAKDTNVAISAAITEYARIEMHNMVTLLRKEGIWVHYWDTDSLIASDDISKYPELYKKLVPDGTGKTLGSLKNEFIDKISEFLPTCCWTETEKVAKRAQYHAEVERMDLDYEEMDRLKEHYEEFLEKPLYSANEISAIMAKCKLEGFRFDRGVIVGAKIYLLDYELPKGRKFTMSAFKGFNKHGVDLTYEDLMKMVSGEVYEPFKNTPDNPELIEEVYQDEEGEWQTRQVIKPAGGQISFQGGKKVLLTETTVDATIKIKKVKKKFALNYDKARWNKNRKFKSQKLKPLVLTI